MTAVETISRLVSVRFVPLALRNLLANKRRLVRSSAGIGFAILLMLVQLGFERGFFDASLATVRQLDGDLFFMNADKYRVATRDPFPHRYLADATKVAAIASVSPLYASWQDFYWKDPASDQQYLVQTFGFDPDHPAFLLPDVQADSSKLKAEDAVLIDRSARAFLGMDRSSGDTEINGRKVHIVGNFPLGPDFVSDGTVMMSDRTFAQLLPGNREGAAAMPVELGIVKLKPGESVAQVEPALRAALPASLKVMSKDELVDFEREFQAKLSSAGPIFWLGTLVGFVVGMLISYQIIYTDLSEQLPQYATLKGMGYQNAYLVGVVLEQAALSALAGYVPAWLMCIVVYWGISKVALLPLHMTLSLTLLSFGLTLGMCLFSASLAIRRVIAADPAEVF
ncbi:MAG TPA: ABC transporter permease DevC [Stellaceae bacterium]|jgi:putative ABC transport system permease protein|nr:ABC transporter permease DevC [Stellaceae bacterium]